MAATPNIPAGESDAPRGNSEGPIQFAEDSIHNSFVEPILGPFVLPAEEGSSEFQ